MRTLRYFLLFIILLFGVLSCRDVRLSDIESYIDSRPDSALAAIRQIDTTALRGRAVKAKYSLLHAMALDKNYIDTADTRIVQPAIDWYSRHGSPEEKLTAYLRGEGISEEDIATIVIRGYSGNVGPSCGQIEVVFTFPKQTDHGSVLVAFENLYYEDVLLVTHADIEDVEQTVYFPNIGTQAAVEGKKEFYPEDKIELVDTVSYENLIPGELYEVSGSLKHTDGSDFTVNGQPIVCVLRFVPETASGNVEVKFHFDASSMKTGDKLVVFEKMYLINPAICENGEQVDQSILIASHEDLNDEGQTVIVTEKPKVPKTGETDSTGNILIGLIAICIGGVIAFVVIKKKNDD